MLCNVSWQNDVRMTPNCLSTSTVVWDSTHCMKLKRRTVALNTTHTGCSIKSNVYSFLFVWCNQYFLVVSKKKLLHKSFWICKRSSGNLKSPIKSYSQPTKHYVIYMQIITLSHTMSHDFKWRKIMALYNLMGIDDVMTSLAFNPR